MYICIEVLRWATIGMLAYVLQCMRSSEVVNLWPAYILWQQKEGNIKGTFLGIFGQVKGADKVLLGTLIYT